MKRRTLIIGSIIGFAVLISLTTMIGGVAVVIYVFQNLSDFGFPDFDDPEILSDPRVHEDLIGVEKLAYYTQSGMGEVSDLQYGDLVPQDGNELGIVTSSKAVYLNADKRQVHSLDLDFGTGRLEIVRTRDGAVFGYINSVDWASNVTFINADGEIAWTFGESEHGIEDIASGDIDGDGLPEFAAGFDDWLYLLDTGGEEIWSKRADTWGVDFGVDFADTTGNGDIGIVHSDIDGQMVIRDVEGDLVYEIELDVYFKLFSMCPWPTAESRTYPVVTEEDAIKLINYDGGTLATFDAPDIGTFGQPRATSVKLHPDEGAYFACVVDFGYADAAIFYLFNAAAQRVYLEVLRGACTAIVAIPDESADKEKLLIGGTGIVWEYRLLPPEP